MDETLFIIDETPITWVNLLTFLGIIVLSFLVAKGIARATRMSKKMSSSALYGLSRLSYYAVFLIGFYIALTIIGIDLTGIAVVVGALSVGIGFGLQAIFNNFVAGIIVLLEKKVCPGDFIQLDAGEGGYVVEIHVRTTVIQTLDHRKIIIPNTEIISKRVKVGGGLHRLSIPFSTSREFDKEKVRAIATKAAQSVDLLEEKRPVEVWLSKLTEKSAEYELTVWVNQKEDRVSASAFLWALEDHFAQAGAPLLQGALTLHS